VNPRVLFLDHVGVLGGAVLFLLDVALYQRGFNQVLLLEDGPLCERLAQKGVAVEVLSLSRSVSSIKHEGSGLGTCRPYQQRCRSIGRCSKWPVGMKFCTQTPRKRSSLALWRARSLISQ
jgi:hypothetical protein